MTAPNGKQVAGSKTGSVVLVKKPEAVEILPNRKINNDE
jgi:hypothetical protein